jgi:hypothetical protein
MTTYWYLCIKIVMLLCENMSAQAPVAGGTNSASRWSTNSSLSKFSLRMLIWKISIVNFMKNAYFEGQCLLGRPAVDIFLKNVYLEVHLLSFSWKMFILKVSGRNFHEECLFWRLVFVVFMKNANLEGHLLSFSWMMFILKVSFRSFHEECLFGRPSVVIFMKDVYFEG